MLLHLLLFKYQRYNFTFHAKFNKYPFRSKANAAQIQRSIPYQTGQQLNPKTTHRMIRRHL
jgi:hypothetical protein